MGILKSIGIGLIVVWLVLWLVVKITVAAVHLVLLLGLAAIVFGFIQSKSRPG